MNTVLWPFAIMRFNEKTQSGIPISGVVCDIKAESADHALQRFHDLGVFSPPTTSLRYRALSVLQPPDDDC